MKKLTRLILLLVTLNILTLSTATAVSAQVTQEMCIPHIRELNLTSLEEKILVDDEPGFDLSNGNPPEDYTSINEAIKAAHTDDIIYVFDGSYKENIIINKKITILGEVKKYPIIDGNKKDDVILITADNVIIAGFTIQNSGNQSEKPFDAGIKIQSNENLIQNNKIQDNEGVGILVNHSKYNKIFENTISNNHYGILLINSTNNTIIKNNVVTSQFSSCLYHSSNNTVVYNIVSDNYLGICINNATKNNVTKNKISNCKYGVYLYYSWENSISKNNFIENKKRNAVFRGTIEHKNTWENNYWSRFRLLPKPIFGKIGELGLLCWIRFDKNPAREPNSIQP